jgi:putative DNA primase/helicase
LAQSKEEYAYQIASKVIEELHPVFIPEYDEIRVLKEGVLSPFGDSDIRTYLEPEAKSENTNSFFSLVCHHIKGSCKKNLSEFSTSGRFINVKNGYVDVETGELLVHNTNNLFLEQFPIKFDPKAHCPNFLKVFRQIVPDPMERFSILRSWAVCFDTRPLKRESDLWIGERDTGKTTLLNVLRVMLGQKNYSNLTLYQLTDSNDRFSVAHLDRKAANICDDLQSIELKETGQYKVITGGGSINAQHKGKPHFEYSPYGKLFFACNSPPVLLDEEILADLAFFERFRIRFFTERIKREYMDFALTDLVDPQSAKLTNSKEISGLFNILLGILRSVRHWQDYGYALDGEKTKEIWLYAQASSDSVSRFLNETVIVKEKSLLPVLTLRQAWETWRVKKKIAPISPTQFNERVEKISYQTKRGIRSWVNLAFKDSTNLSLDDLDRFSFATPSMISPRVPIFYRKRSIPSSPYDILGKNFLSSENSLRSWFSDPLRITHPICQMDGCIMKGRQFDSIPAFSEHERLIHNGGLGGPKL